MFINSLPRAHLMRCPIRFTLSYRPFMPSAHHRQPTPWCRYYHVQISRTPSMISWDLKSFRDEAFVPEVPRRLPRDDQQLPEACRLWFAHGGPGLASLKSGILPKSSELDMSFWTAFEDTQVPLELTANRSDPTKMVFHRSMAPLKLMLDFLSLPSSKGPELSSRESSIYLAQCPLPSLPSALRASVPTPELVERAGKGDIYDSSLWLGRPPTYTPLHRDPNPNLFIQLAGSKVVRLLPPDIGDAVFDRVQQIYLAGPGGKTIRGEEMMVGRQQCLLEAGVWGSDSDVEEETVQEIKQAMSRFGQEAQLGLGEALFIPKGWWHSVKGVGEGITASVNWWFR